MKLLKLDRYQFEVLAYVADRKNWTYNWRELVDELCISGARAVNSLDILKTENLIRESGGVLYVTDSGFDALEPYRVKKAVIFAAGFGSRMVPVTLDTPKPLVSVNGTRIIDRLIDALVAVGISDITIVRGYLKEKFDILLEKYPFLTFIDNDRYEEENNISSALVAEEKIDGCYICAGDLLLSNPSIIKKYHYCSDYLGSFSLETDDWCFDSVNGMARNYRKGGTYCYNQYEIAYWTKEDCEKLRHDWKKAYSRENGKDLFWEVIPLTLFSERYEVEIRPCKKTDIIEIDNFDELVEIDSSYRDYK